MTKSLCFSLLLIVLFFAMKPALVCFEEQTYLFTFGHPLLTQEHIQVHEFVNPYVLSFLI